jgi:FlaA1/EpsC-like NDP-sugar epimerase
MPSISWFFSLFVSSRSCFPEVSLPLSLSLYYMFLLHRSFYSMSLSPSLLFCRVLVCNNKVAVGITFSRWINIFYAWSYVYLLRDLKVNQFFLYWCTHTFLRKREPIGKLIEREKEVKRKFRASKTVFIGLKYKGKNLQHLFLWSRSKWQSWLETDQRLDFKAVLLWAKFVHDTF